jgi:hypothetical protein
VAGVVNGLFDQNLEHLSTRHIGDGACGRAGIGERSAAGCKLLRITLVVFDEPGRRLEQFEMRIDRGRCNGAKHCYG